MSWLSDRLGIHLGNVGAPVGAAIGSIIPGLGTTAGAALGQGLGAWGHGDGIPSAIGQAGLTYGIGRGLGALRDAFAPSSAAVGATQGTGAPTNPFGINPEDLIKPNVPSADHGLMDRLGSAADWAGNHANAVGQGLQGLGQIATAGPTNAYHRAQADQLNTENDANRYALELQRRRDASLEPLRRLLAGQMQSFMQNNHGVAPNPYGASPNPYRRG